MTNINTEAWGFETKQVHAGQEVPDPATGARVTPIYQTAAFVFDDFDHAQARFALQDAGGIYGRLTNPTVDALEKRIAALEGGVAALAVASGAAAVTYTVQTLAQAGGHIVASKTLYGGTYTLLAHTLREFGVETTFVDPYEPGAFEAAFRENTKGVLIESLGNPHSNAIDIREVADIAHSHGVPLVVDNTFATPYLLRPIEHGADIVIHSATKFIGGHGATLGGVIVDGGQFDWRGGHAPGGRAPAGQPLSQVSGDSSFAANGTGGGHAPAGKPLSHASGGSDFAANGTGGGHAPAGQPLSQVSGGNNFTANGTGGGHAPAGKPLSHASGGSDFAANGSEAGGGGNGDLSTGATGGRPAHPGGQPSTANSNPSIPLAVKSIEQLSNGRRQATGRPPGPRFAALTEPCAAYHGLSFVQVAGPAAFTTRVRAVLLRDTGATLSPMNAFLLLQGAETLSLRVERHVQNALAVVEFLRAHPAVLAVHHPSLAGEPGHGAYAKYYPSGAGTIFTFDLKGGREAARAFIDRLKLFSLLANVADAKSLVIHPASTTHAQLSPAELEEQRIGGGTVRLSIGIESIGDILADLEQALR